MATKNPVKKIWQFLWHSDSMWSLFANILIAFILIKFVIYPLIGVVFGTSYPIVAVISESMQHDLSNQQLCGEQFDEFKDSFSNYWQICGPWYENQGITQQQFQKFPFPNGFNKGDIVIVWRGKPQSLELGDVLIFQGSKPQPIIHRIVKKWSENGRYYFQTKGDHNKDSITGSSGETQIGEDRILGKGLLRIPYLGWIKIIFVQAVKPFGWTITT
ncbi:signal peptidase I [Candidatus Woesearchaeota archaeon]|nr:signal peptidase I [Candidatus Woesearchaeota archaeon]